MNSSSSPDPLSAAHIPSLSRSRSRSRSRSVAPAPPTPVKSAKSPKKTQSSSMRLPNSPWKIKVVVEAEQEGSDEEVVKPKKRGGGRGKAKVVTRTKTTKVPIKGGESPLAPARNKTPTKKRTPRKKKGESEKEKDVQTEDTLPELPALPAETNGLIPTPTPQKITQRKRRTTKAPPAEPTLASTRVRRSATSMTMTSTPVRGPRNRLGSEDVSSTRSVSRSILGGKDPNMLLSPSPEKEMSKSRSPSYDVENVTTKGFDTFVLSEGGTVSLPEIMGSPSPPLFSRCEERDGNESEEEALADIESERRSERTRIEETADEDLQFTYLSIGASYTPRKKKSGAVPTPQSLSTPQQIGVHTFYGTSPISRSHEQDEPEQQNVIPDVMLPDELAGSPVQSGAAEFTYLHDPTSYTPRTKKGPFDGPGSAQKLNSPREMSEDTFYGPPIPSELKGKGKAVDSSGVVTPEDSPELESPGKPSFYPSSPPRAAEPELPPLLPEDSHLKTPAHKRRAEKELPTPPGMHARRKIDRETPNLDRVVEASELMSDALDVEEPMRMETEEFGEESQHGPLTPESRSSPPVEDEEGSERTSYPSLAHATNSGSATPSIVVQPPAGDNTESRYLDQIFAKIGPDSPLLVDQARRSPAETWMPTDPLGSPSAKRPSCSPPTPSRLSPRYPQIPAVAAATTTPVRGDRTALLEAEWAREREENRRKAQEVGAITIYDETLNKETDESSHERTRALEEQWARERSQVRREAQQAGAITIHDDTVQSDHSSERSERSEHGALSHPLDDTAAFEKSLAKHPSSDNDDPVRSFSHVFATTTSTGSTPSNIAPTSSINRARIISHIDYSSSSTDSNSQPPLIWKATDYSHLIACLSSRNTKPTNTRYSVQLSAHPQRWISEEVVERLGLQGKRWLNLTERESAAVGRFLRREKAVGREWPVNEVVRRIAGVRVAEVRRRVVRERVR